MNRGEVRWYEIPRPDKRRPILTLEVSPCPRIEDGNDAVRMGPGESKD